MYARFLTKALHDMGLLPFTEPFTRLTMVQALRNRRKNTNTKIQGKRCRHARRPPSRQTA